MGRFDPALTVSWERLDLVVRRGGDLVVTTVEERLQILCRCPDPDARPIVVWLMDPADYADGPKPRWSLPRDWPITFAMERFRRFRVAVPRLPESDLKTRYGKELGFRWFDPALRPVGEPLTGKLVASSAEFARRQTNAWKAGFTTPLVEYADAMRKIRERRRKNDRLLRRLTIRSRWLAKEPDPEKTAQWEADWKAAQAERKEIDADEAARRATVKVRPEFLPPAEEDSPGESSSR